MGTVSSLVGKRLLGSSLAVAGFSGLLSVLRGWRCLVCKVFLFYRSEGGHVRCEDVPLVLTLCTQFFKQFGESFVNTLHRDVLREREENNESHFLEPVVQHLVFITGDQFLDDLSVFVDERKLVAFRDSSQRCAVSVLVKGLVHILRHRCKDNILGRELVQVFNHI